MDDMESKVALGLRWSREITNREAKEEIASVVAGMAANGDVIGAGSGSTSFLTVVALGERVKGGLAIACVPTSIEIEMACSALGIPIATPPGAGIDWCFDGADEVDPRGRLIKGRGGALHRERQVFAASRRRVVVADSSKTVESLGSNFPVPVEVDPRMIFVAVSRIEELAHVTSCDLRLAENKDGPVVTENGNLLLDVRFSLIDDDDEDRLRAIPGVCCTGIFSGFEFERIG
jgi:ribose 5-phosphate isomerase A